MNNKEQLIKLFDFLNKKKNKLYPFHWTALNFTNRLQKEDFLNVTRLCLANQQLSTIPKWLLNCKNLVYLDLTYNNISKIENLENCTKLERLDLDFNKLTKLENLESLTSLHTLNVTNMRYLDTTSFRTLHPKIKIYE